MPGSYLYLWDPTAEDWVKGIGDDEGKLVLSSEAAIPVGKIPSGATQIAAYTSVEGDIGPIHSVGTGVTLYLSLASLWVINISAAGKIGRLVVRNVANEEQYRLIGLRPPAGEEHSQVLSFQPPLEIPTGWDIALFSEAADVYARGFLHGYEL